MYDATKGPDFPIPKAVVTIDGVESEETDRRGYYAIRIPGHGSRVTVIAGRGDYQQIDSEPVDRAEHITRIGEIALQPLIQTHNPALRDQLHRREAMLRTARSSALIAATTDSIRTIRSLLASARYVDCTYTANVSVASMECRRGLRPTLFGYEPFAYRAPVQRCVWRPVTVRQPFDVDSPQEAQANAEAIRLADQCLQSIRPQIASPVPIQSAY